MIEIRMSPQKGRGIFAVEAIAADTLIEEAPVIVMPEADRVHLDQTLLHDYIFEWGEDHRQCALALGFVSIYNHSADANCDYEMDFETGCIRISSIRNIAAGEELCINYHGQPDDERPVWFKTS